MEICWDARPAAHSSTTTLVQDTLRPKIRQNRSTLTLLNADECFCYLHRYKVLVCLEHTTGIQNLNSHLRDYHAVPAKERKAIVEKYSWAAIETADQVRLPAPMGRPIQELGEPIRGLQCAEG